MVELGIHPRENAYKTLAKLWTNHGKKLLDYNYLIKLEDRKKELGVSEYELTLLYLIQEKEEERQSLFKAFYEVLPLWNNYYGSEGLESYLEALNKLGNEFNLVSPDVDFGENINL